MKTNFWIRINSRGSVHTSQGPPRSIGVDEVAMKINLELPNALFTKPQLEASLTVPNEAVNKEVLTPQVTDNIAQAIKQSTGLDMVIRIVDPAEEKTDDPE